MASIRQVILATNEIYHIFNRSIDRRIVFNNKKEYQRALDVIGYYKFSKAPVRYSVFKEFTDNKRQTIYKTFTTNELEVKIIAYCLMPNHFHLLVRQEKEGGISRFISNFCNSYTKYFNTKHKRLGPLYQGPFKAVRVESDEQLIHLSRYIHLNPVSSFMIKKENLEKYLWSSFSEYLGSVRRNISEPDMVLYNFKNVETYRQFVYNQISYAQELEKIKHLMFEE